MKMVKVMSKKLVRKALEIIKAMADEGDEEEDDEYEEDGDQADDEKEDKEKKDKDD